jgi:glycosyltransferase involved in cell wall biosynthesis
VNKEPLISIGVPAYNAAASIGSTIEGLLAQSFGDFELIVSDNASDDGTRDVVENYRLRDGRIRYECQSVNIGANANYSHVVHGARGEFFKWSSSSDWCAPTFLERCLEEIKMHSDTVLVAPRTRLFQGNPGAWQDYAFDIEVLDDTPQARLARLYSTLRLNNAMNGLIRMSALRRTRLVEPYLSADVVLMGHLALLGKFRLLPERLFYRRMEAGFATALQDPGAVLKHHYPQPSARTLLQGCKRLMGRVRATLSTSMPIGQKLRSLIYVTKTCYWERTAILEDLRGVWQYCIRGTWPK